jgi:hypothetical protein
VKITGNVTEALAALDALGIKAVETAAKTEGAMAGAATRTGNVFTKLGRTLSGWGIPFTDGLTRMGEKISETEGTAQRLGATMAAVGKTAVIGGALGLALAGAEAVKGASHYQQATTLLVTAAGEQESKLKSVSDGILKISGETGTSADQLAEGMYTVEKAGYRAADGLNVLKMSAEGAKAENVDMATMTNAVTSVMTSYHEKSSQAVSVVNEMVAASGAAKTTMQAFAGSLSTVLPVASANKISFEEVGGAIATLTQHGTSADEATQELSNTIRNLSAPNQVAQKEMQQLGLNVTDLSTHLGQRGLTGTLDLIVGAITSKMGPAGTVLLDTFKKSQSASQDLQIMLKSMPSDLRDISQQFLDGSIGAKEYQQGFKAMGADGNAMGTQFLGLTKQAKGFNDLLKSGQPAAQTFTDALKKTMGGATGMNTALMLSGENMAGFKDRVDEISTAAEHSGKDVSTWGRTQQEFSVKLAQVVHSLEAVGIEAGEDLLPKLTQLLGVVQTGGHIFMDVAHAVGDIPGPLKSVGVEAAIAAVVFPKLAAGVTGSTEAVTLNMAALRQWRAEMTYDVTRQQFMTSTLTRLGSAARTAAGIGGMVALANGAGHAGTAIGGLETTAGAAAMGFSMGGPLGAALGGAGGLFFSLAKRVHDADENMSALQVQTAQGIKVKVDKSAVESLIASLEKAHGDYRLLDQDAKDQALGSKVNAGQQATVTAKTGLTSKTQADIYAGDPGAIAAGQKALVELASKLDAFQAAQAKATELETWSSWSSGMSAMGASAAKDFAAWGATVEQAYSTGAIDAKAYVRDMKDVAAAQSDGVESAQDRNRAIQMGAALDAAAGKASKSYTDATRSLKTELGTGAQINQGYNASLRNLAAALGITVGQIHKMPKNVQSKIELDGAPQTQDQATKLLHDLGKLLTFKQLRSVISLAGVDLSRSQLDGYLAQIKATPRQVVTAYKAEGIQLTKQDVQDLQSKFNLTPKQVKILLHTDGVQASKADVKSLGDAADTASKNVTHAVTKARGTAASGGPQIGSDLASGVVAGLNAGDGPVSAAARVIIAHAIASMKNEADSHSPSRKTMRLAGDMVDGWTIGMEQRVDDVVKSGANMIQAFMTGIDVNGRMTGGGRHDSPFGNTALLSKAGQKIVDELAHGMRSKKGELKSALKEIKSEVTATGKEISAATSWGQAFAENNIFSAGLSQNHTIPGKTTTSIVNGMKVTQTTPSTTGTLTGTALLESMLKYQTKQTTQDEHLEANVKKLRKEGLSKSLLDQMSSAGTSGLAEINALAGASKAQIEQFNALNQRQQKALANAGALATTGHTMNQLHAEQRTEKMIERAITRSLKHVSVKTKGHKKGRGTA